MIQKINSPKIKYLLRGQVVAKRPTKPDARFAHKVVHKLGGRVFEVSKQLEEIVLNEDWYKGPGFYIQRSPFDSYLLGPCETKQNAVWFAFYMLTAGEESTQLH